MLKSLLLAGTFCASLLAYNSFAIADEAPEVACKVHIPFGMPVSNDKTKTFATICHTGYLSHYDESAKDPDWVAYTLTPEHAIGCADRSNAFKKDPLLNPLLQASPQDYAGQGYDKGHLANDEDMRYNETVERESFFMTNMTPQLPSFNRGIWKNLEDDVRSWSVYRKIDSLNVISGSIYNVKTDKKIGQDNVDVPTGFFKIIIDMTTKPVSAIAFKFDNQATANNDQLTDHLSSIADIEKAANIVIPLPSEVDKSKVNTLWPYTQGEFAKDKKIFCKK